MPSRSAHIDWAQRNEQVAVSLQIRHPDWAVTALFYAAVHWVDAVLDGLDGSEHPANHRQRHGAIARQPQLAPIEAEYRKLFDDSVASRYDCVDFYPSDVTYLRETRFEPIRDVCRRLLGLT